VRLSGTFPDHGWFLTNRHRITLRSSTWKTKTWCCISRPSHQWTLPASIPTLSTTPRKSLRYLG